MFDERPQPFQNRHVVFYVFRPEEYQFFQVDHVPTESEIMIGDASDDYYEEGNTLDRPHEIIPINTMDYGYHTEDLLIKDEPSFMFARYPIQYFLFCLGFTFLLALLFRKAIV